MEEVKNNVQEEVKTNPQESQEPNKAVDQVQENEEQINWRKFREQREIDRKQKEEAAKIAEQKAKEVEALKMAMDAILNKPISSQNDPDLSEEDIIEKKVLAALEKRDAELRRQKEIEESKKLPQTLKTTFSDFDQVCNQENLDYLEYHYPEVAAGFKYAPDSFDKWANIYKAVKRFIPNPNSQSIDAKIQKNLNKPQSISVPGVSGSGDVAPNLVLNDAQKQQRWIEMQKIMRGG